MTLLRIVARQAAAALKARVRDVAIRGAWLGLALIAILFALLFATGAGWLWLATLMAPWYAALCVAGGWLLLAAIAVLAARQRPQPAAPEIAGEATQLSLAEARAKGEALARQVEPEHLVIAGLIAGIAAGRRMGRRRDAKDA